MGSSYVARTFADCSKEQLKRAVEDAIRESAHESGHSYSGDWGSKDYGLEFLTKTFSSESDAEDYIQENNDKYEPLMAVRVPVLTTITEQNKGSKITALETKVNTLREKQNDFMPGIIRRTMATKSALKSCEHCNSKINIKAYIERHKFGYNGKCPVCVENLLLTNTDNAAKAKIDTDLATAEKQLQVAREERSKALTKNIVYEWYVGGWCSS